MEARLKKAFYKDKVPNLEEFIKRTENFASEAQARIFYNDQEIVQLHRKPNPKYKLVNHYSISIPNQRHEVDILFLPEDQGYPYCFVLIDCATRYKSAYPMKNKEAKECKAAIKHIYDNDEYLDYPVWLYTDAGSEFKGQFHTYVSNLDLDTTLAKRCLAPSYKTTHIQTNRGTHLAFVERFNATLAKEIFKVQQFRELQTRKAQRKWVEMLQPLIKTLNDSKTRLINMKPIDAMKLDEVPQPANHFTEEDVNKRWPDGTLVRYLLEHDEYISTDKQKAKTDARRRNTDILWSISLYRVAFAFQTCKECLWLHGLVGVGNAKPNDRMYNYWSLQPVGE